MQLCQAPTLRLKALNKYNNTHNVHRHGTCYQQFNKQTEKLTDNVDINKGSSITMQKTHRHRHTDTDTQTDRHTRTHARTHARTHTLHRLI